MGQRYTVLPGGRFAPQPLAQFAGVGQFAEQRGRGAVERGDRAAYGPRSGDPKRGGAAGFVDWATLGRAAAGGLLSLERGCQRVHCVGRLGLVGGGVAVGPVCLAVFVQALSYLSRSWLRLGARAGLAGGWLAAVAGSECGA